MPKKHIASTEGGGGGEEGGGMPGGGGDVAFVPLVMFCRSAVVSRVVSVPLVPLAKRVPSISSVRSRVLSLSGGGRRSPYELVRIWLDGAIRAQSERNQSVRREQSASLTRNQQTISCNHLTIKCDAQGEERASAVGRRMSVLDRYGEWRWRRRHADDVDDAVISCVRHVEGLMRDAIRGHRRP